MAAVTGAEDRVRVQVLVKRKDVLDAKDPRRGIAVHQNHLVRRGQTRPGDGINREHQWDAPRLARGEVHRLADGTGLDRVQELPERRVPALSQQIQIAQLAKRSRIRGDRRRQLTYSHYRRRGHLRPLYPFPIGILGIAASLIWEGAPGRGGPCILARIRTYPASARFPPSRSSCWRVPNRAGALRGKEDRDFSLRRDRRDTQPS